jgi:hypothetical protein
MSMGSGKGREEDAIHTLKLAKRISATLERRAGGGEQRWREAGPPDGKQIRRRGQQRSYQ